ncbi:hypothetical protein B566_EDAN011548 [Ephemera danica]|nr:hypothetical protein B566_EDAN011548 [Ephemera danica]
MGGLLGTSKQEVQKSVPVPTVPTSKYSPWDIDPCYEQPQNYVSTTWDRESISQCEKNSYRASDGATNYSLHNDDYIRYKNQGMHASLRRYASDIMFVVRVLVTEFSLGDGNTVLPTNGSDTTTRIDGKVVVKFDDYTFYPEYLVTLSPAPRNYNDEHSAQTAFNSELIFAEFSLEITPDDLKWYVELQSVSEENGDRNHSLHRLGQSENIKVT